MAAPVEVQYGATATNSVGSASRVYASSVTAGHYSVVLAYASGSDTGLGTVADTQGNTYTVVASSVVGGIAAWVSVFTALIGTTGACTVTYTNPVSPRDIVVAAVEVSVAGGTVLGVEATARGTGSSAAPTSGSLVTTVDTLMLAMTGMNIFNTWTVGSGWTQRASTGWPQQTSSLITRTSAAGSYVASWANSEVVPWQVVAIALKEASAAVETAQGYVWGPV